MSEVNVNIIGTGTIGWALAILTARHKDELGIDNVISSKHSPRATDAPAIQELARNGVKLAVERSQAAAFKGLGIEPDLTVEDARNSATVIVDCTPKGVGIQNKNRWYEQLITTKSVKLIVAQGSEAGFGRRYAFGINDKAINPSTDKFLQIVSCNTHALAIVLQLIGGKDLGNIDTAHFHCVRRATDMSQASKGQLSPQVTPPKGKSGTHHAVDVIMLYDTLGLEPDITSGAVIVPTQLMHVVHFGIHLNNALTKDEIEDRFRRDFRTAVTLKDSTNLVYEHIRANSRFIGRMLNYAVLAPSLMVQPDHNDSPFVMGDVFVAQDSNSLISSLAAIAMGVNPKGYKTRVTAIAKQYLFDEV